jgi:hypothetical protein
MRASGVDPVLRTVRYTAATLGLAGFGRYGSMISMSPTRAATRLLAATDPLPQAVKARHSTPNAVRPAPVRQVVAGLDFTVQ